MSGGHWDCYPYFDGVEDLFRHEEVFKSMVDYCRENNKQEIANELERFWLDVRSAKSSLEVKFQRIKGLLQSVDHEASFDCRWDSVEKELKKLKGEQDE